MLEIREAYLTIRQMKNIGIDTAFDDDMNIQKQRESAENAAKQICAKPYFPLYEKNNMKKSIAYYFTAEGVIIPTGLNELKRKIYDRWDHLDAKKGFDDDNIVEYRSASNNQTAHLYAYLNQFIKPNGFVTEPELSFLSSVDYLLFREGSKWQQYKMVFQRPYNFKGISLPVWNYPFGNGKEFLDDWAKLYQKYGLVPDVPEILAWLNDLPKSKTVRLSEEQYQKLKEYYRQADYLRLGSKYYLLSRGIFDNGQCWDVFEKGQLDKNKIRCVFPDGEWLSAKVSAENIVNGGLVSIDFGTKSTVVVISDQTKNSFYTLKSKKNYSESSLYPTVLKFCSLKKFLEVYKSEMGRPETRWEDVSIDDSIHEGGRSDLALGIFRSLKQWMMDSKSRGVVLRQMGDQSQSIILNEYGSEKNSVDPIELYAYYLGLYINNNQDNKIFMRYRLSFSATCPEQIQHKMRESFRRGLTKSLPTSIIESNNMENFLVDCTCSEPAAYAVCALAFMGIPNQCQKYFFYGIFDFGGGTCDFNYGIWGLEEDEKLHKSKYKIWILGDGGDPFLGGENLLELLAVQVCIEQREWFKEYGYKISRPRCYEGGEEDFFAASFEAENNLECLVDQLRNPIWENPDNCDEEGEEFEIVVSGLMHEEGVDTQAAPAQLSLSRKPLEKFLENRINNGISEFFNTFYCTLEEQGQKEVPMMCVFLAGNSCHSKWVRMGFEKYIAKQDNKYIKKIYLCDPMGASEFKEHIPSDLWDEEQKESMDVRFSNIKDLDGKTGVAYGLALYGNQVEIEDRRVKNYLLYYLGTKNFFDIAMLQGTHGKRLVIGESIPFATSVICDLYYTKVIPKNGNLRGTKVIMLNEQNVLMKENMTCFVRANSQTEISIFAALGDSPKQHDPKDELIIDLESGQFKKSINSNMKG